MLRYLRAEESRVIYFNIAGYWITIITGGDFTALIDWISNERPWRYQLLLLLKILSISLDPLRKFEVSRRWKTCSWFYLIIDLK